MIISDFYQTKIEANSYNVNIDSTDTVVTVSLIDFNGAPVTGKSVTLTCDKGYFNKYGSTAISGDTTKSVTATTDSNGKITATWTASEWGLSTFSVNNVNIQIKVTGWKKYRNDSNYKVYYNDEYVWFRFDASGVNATTSWAELGANVFPDAFLRPSTNIFFFIGMTGYIGNVRPDSPKFRYRTQTGSGNNLTLTGEVMWRRQ